MKKDMLKKMKMPSAAMPEDDMLSMEEDSMEEGMPPPEGMLEEGGLEEASPIVDMADEDIIKELEMRGFDVSALMASLEEGQESPEEDMEGMEEMDMEEDLAV